MTEPDLDIEGWPEGGWAVLAANACEAATSIATELANKRLTSSLLLTTDSEIHALNREWRERDKATNVLSFPMLARDELLSLSTSGPPVMLGDIALAYETCAREAAEKAIPVTDHTAHLIIHGLLHLAGYDHEISPADADAMEALEIRALATMGIGNPYESSAHTGAPEE